MKKILLAGINARFSHSNPALYYLKAVIKDTKFTPLIREFSINQPVNRIFEEIKEINPHVTAISVYIWNSETVKTLIPMIKKALPGTSIILGGPEVSYNPQEWIDGFPEIDFIITGAGESSMRTLLMNNTQVPEKIINIPNIPFREIPFPYTREDLDGLKNRFLYYETSRGCPFRCSYCLSSRSDQKLEFLPTERVEEELLTIMKHSPGTVKFVDRTFNIKPEHSRAIWKFLIDKFSDKNTTFHFEIYPALLSDEDLAILSKAPDGLFQFEIGIQSTCKKALEAVNRKENWVKIKPIIEKTISLKNIHIHVDLIAGLPFEDWQTLRESFNNIYSLHASHFQAGILKILKGTEIHEKAKEFGIKWDKKAPFTISENRWIQKEKISLFKTISKLVDIVHNNHLFETTLTALEDLTESPFDLFEKMAGLADVKKLNKGFEAGAELILKFAEENLKDERDYILDTLRWDFCLRQKSHRYPELLKSDFTNSTGRKGFTHIIRFSKKGIIRFKEAEFSQEELKKSIFFSAETSKFRNKFMTGSEFALFLPSKKALLFDNRER